MKAVKSTNLCKSVIQTMYDIIKAHGGQIRVESQENVGSEFIFLLRLNE
jgi:signal transduction histidine kinase